MKRFIVNYAGAWLTGFKEAGCSMDVAPGPNRIRPTYAPVWGDEQDRKNYGDLAYSIVDVIRRGGVDCEVTKVP